MLRKNDKSEEMQENAAVVDLGRCFAIFLKRIS